MTDQHTNLLQAILLELKCMNEALRAPAGQEAMPVLKHQGESVLLSFSTKTQDWARGGAVVLQQSRPMRRPAPSPTVARLALQPPWTSPSNP